MKCPVCGLINPDNTVKCGCGYIFTTQREPLYKPFSHMGVRGFFFNSWRTYRVNWKVFLLLGAFYTIVSAGIGFVTGEILDVASDIISSIMLVFTILAITMTAHRASERVVLSIKEVFTLSLFSGFFWQYIWTWVRYFLIILCVFVFYIILFILSRDLRFILSDTLISILINSSLLPFTPLHFAVVNFVIYFIMFIPLIIWIIWITTRYTLASYAVVIEGLKTKQAVLLSLALTKGKRFSIFLHEGGFGLLFLLLISIPVALFTWLIAAALGEPFHSEISFFGPGELKIEKTPNYANQEWAQVIRIFVATIWIELQIIFNMLLFKSLRM